LVSIATVWTLTISIAQVFPARRGPTSPVLFLISAKIGKSGLWHGFRTLECDNRHPGRARRGGEFSGHDLGTLAGQIRLKIKFAVGHLGSRRRHAAKTQVMTGIRYPQAFYVPARNETMVKDGPRKTRPGRTVLDVRQSRWHLMRKI